MIFRGARYGKIGNMVKLLRLKWRRRRIWGSAIQFWLQPMGWIAGHVGAECLRGQVGRACVHFIGSQAGRYPLSGSVPFQKLAERFPYSLEGSTTSRLAMRRRRHIKHGRFSSQTDWMFRPTGKSALLGVGQKFGALPTRDV